MSESWKGWCAPWRTFGSDSGRQPPPWKRLPFPMPSLGATATLIAAGFFHQETLDVHMFLDSPEASVRDAVHVLIAGEKVKKEDLLPTPDVAESEAGAEFRILAL